jgi:hypothetical protein
MHRLLTLFSVIVAVFLFAAPVSAQWACVYATNDDNADGNATGINTPGVVVFGPNTFAGLINNGSCCLFVPYKNADSAKGRLYAYGYGSGTADKYLNWTDDGFDQVQMIQAWNAIATSDGTIYVPSNDAERNILVFQFANDTIRTHPAFHRQPTGTNSIHGIAVDNAGYVYVCNDTTSGKTDDIKIYPPITTWNTSHTATPVRTIDLPDGVYKGLTVSPDGKLLFVSDYNNRTILKYRGTPTGGYTQDAGFQCTLLANDSIATGTRPAFVGLTYKATNNILFASATRYRAGGSWYPWGRAYLINPNTGNIVSVDSAVSVIDFAKWNFTVTNSYSNRINGIASGYTSTYAMAFDSNGDLYTQSHYGWTVDKWHYTGTLPTVTLTGVEKTDDAIPSSIELGQNYPNPFNPTTAISYRLSAVSNTSLRVFDLLGREVATLVNENQSPGTYKVTFDASQLTSGTYLYSLTANGTTITKKLMLVK